MPYRVPRRCQPISHLLFADDAIIFCNPRLQHVRSLTPSAVAAVLGPTDASPAQENVKALTEQRSKNMKIIQEKMNMNEKEMARFNPVDAFPGDAVIFFRVLNLLRVIFLLQVCAYKNGNVMIDTSAGVLGRYDPRPVQPDSLFPVFSVTKGITAGMVHWLVDKRNLKFEEAIANIWPEFKTNKKEQIKVHHVLTHTSGLHNAMSDVMKSNPLSLCDWDESWNLIGASTPETQPGCEEHSHYLSFG